MKLTLMFMCPNCGSTELSSRHDGDFVKFTCNECGSRSDYDDFYTECSVEETEDEIVIRVQK